MPQGYSASHFRLRWWQGMHAFLARLRLAGVVDMPAGGHELHDVRLRCKYNFPMSRLVKLTFGPHYFNLSVDAGHMCKGWSLHVAKKG
jgi:hypothetical protein